MKSGEGRKRRPRRGRNVAIANANAAFRELKLMLPLDADDDDDRSVDEICSKFVASLVQVFSVSVSFSLSLKPTTSCALVPESQSPFTCRLD